MDLSKLSNEQLAELYKGVGGFGDVSVQPTGASPLAGMSDDDLMAAFQASQQTTTPAQQISTEFQNQQIAAGQRTTPNIGAQMPNLVSDDVHESDAGFAMFRDPRTGQMVEAQDNKHVILRDPSDNRLKVFARTPETDEGRMSAAGRLLMTGMAAGAPTARAAIPAVGRIPTREALFDAADAGYKSARNLGVQFDPRALSEEAFRIGGALAEDGLDVITAKNTHALLSRLSTAADNSPVAGRFSDLESVRRALGKVASGASSADVLARSDAAAATRAIQAIDDFLSNPGGAVVAGNADELSRIAQEARANYAAASRSARVGRAEDLAELQAATGGSGANIDNAIRQRAKDILKNPKELRGWSKEEIADLRRVAVGTKARNAARLLGKLAPTGIVSMGGGGAVGAGLGFTVAGPAGAAVGAYAVPAAGFAFKKLGDVMTANQLNRLDELLRANSPLGRQMQSSFTDWTAKLDDLVRVPSTPKVAQFALATRNFTNNLRDAGISISPTEFMRLIQGPMKSGAGDEQPESVGVINQ
jgi:hypothetical protein